MFGLLSVGFVASALLTVLGFLLYALFSFRRRFIEMGMLRAIGLSVKQMTIFLAAELASLILLGIGAGTLVGVFASKLFVPFLQIGSTSPGKLSAIPDRDRLAFDFPDLWPVHHPLRGGAGRAVSHSPAHEDLPGNKTRRKQLMTRPSIHPV